MEDMRDAAKWAKEVSRAGFRLYDSRPLGNTIVYGEPLTFHIGFAPADVVNLYSELRELIDGERFFPCFYQDAFVGVLDASKYVRGYLLTHKDVSGFAVTVTPGGTRYANTFEPDCRVKSIEPCEPWQQPDVAQEDPREFLYEAMEQTVAQSAKRAEERKGFFKRLLGR